MTGCPLEEAFAKIFVHFDVGKALHGSAESACQIAQHAPTVLPVGYCRASHFHRSLHSGVVHDKDGANPWPSQVAHFQQEHRSKLPNAANSSCAQRNMFTGLSGNSVTDSDILEDAHSSK